MRALRKDHVAVTVTAMLFGLTLVAVNVVWPKAFVVTVAIGGLLGAFMVLYEVRLTKRLAQAEFIRDLQSGFAGDESIGKIWSKLLLKEEITAADRPMVSSYLTFFETLHLLVDRGALELELADDLFRNRFFTAVGDRGILDTALVGQAGSFANIHQLIATWHDYLLAKRAPIHPGYYGYVRALTEAKGYEVVRLSEEDLDDLQALQDEVLRTMRDAWLRTNSEVMLKECVVHHVTMGARQDGRLVAAAVLYDGGEGDESIKRHLTDDSQKLAKSINLKLVLTLEAHRRQGLSRTLVELLEQQATELGKAEILCTIHAKNKPSRSLFTLLGYEKVGSVSTAYGKRVVYARPLPAVAKRWAR